MQALGERADAECRVYFTGALFEQIEPQLFRFPAIDPARFRRAVADALGPQR